jgi:hypothetical protein
MLEQRNQQMAGHILTIEDPIEFLFSNKKSVINQREVGRDTQSLQVGLRNALRQAPDCILIGEIRDRETMTAAISYALSGHLVLSTLHANNSYHAMGRILSFYPPDSRPTLLADLPTGARAMRDEPFGPLVLARPFDTEAEALAVAQLNLRRHALQARVTLQQGDGLHAAMGPYDLILCNPPYVNQTSMQALPPEYRAEPALALDGGADGMDFIRPLMAQAPAYLRPGGVLVLEIGHERAHFEAAFPGLSPLWLSTSAGDDQVLLLTREGLPP